MIRKKIAYQLILVRLKVQLILANGKRQKHFVNVGEEHCALWNPFWESPCVLCWLFLQLWWLSIYLASKRNTMSWFPPRTFYFVVI